MVGRRGSRDGTVTVVIRRATAADVAVLPKLEAAAGVLFRDLGMDEVADDPPPELAVFAQAERVGRLLVALVDQEVVGFVLLNELDGALHVEQVSVAPEAGRRGIGRRLMAAAVELAREQGFAVMTLTTFRDVPFNGPFYASLGWSPIPETELSPGLRRFGPRRPQRASTAGRVSP